MTTSADSKKIMVDYKFAFLAGQFFENMITRGGLGSYHSTEALRLFGETTNTLIDKLAKEQKRFKKKHKRELNINDSYKIVFTFQDIVTIYNMLGNVASAAGGINRKEISIYCDVREYFIDIILKEQPQKQPTKTVDSLLSSAASSTPAPPADTTSSSVSSSSSSTDTVASKNAPSVSASSSSSSSSSSSTATVTEIVSGDEESSDGSGSDAE